MYTKWGHARIPRRSFLTWGISPPSVVWPHPDMKQLVLFSLDFVSWNIRTWGKTKLTSFLRYHTFKCPYHQNFYLSHPILHFMHWTSAKQFFYLGKKQFCYECLKTWKSYFLAVHPCRWSQHRHTQSCDVDSGTCDFRLDLSRLFYLCKFIFVVHAKCTFPAFCMNY